MDQNQNTNIQPVLPNTKQLSDIRLIIPDKSLINKRRKNIPLLVISIVMLLFYGTAVIKDFKSGAGSMTIILVGILLLIVVPLWLTYGSIRHKLKILKNNSSGLSTSYIYIMKPYKKPAILSIYADRLEFKNVSNNTKTSADFVLNVNSIQSISISGKVKHNLTSAPLKVKNNIQQVVLMYTDQNDNFKFGEVLILMENPTSVFESLGMKPTNVSTKEEFMQVIKG
jgi:hypothetical protein